MRKLVWFLTVLSLANGCIAASPVGQERVYEGTITLNVLSDIRLGWVSTRRSNTQVSMREVTVAPKGKGFSVLSFRFVGSKGNEEGDALQFSLLPQSRLVFEIGPLSPLVFLRLHFLPFTLTLFTPTLNKVGQTWENQQEFVWWSGFGYAGFALPVRYQVVATEKLNGRTCWVVERKVPKAFGQISFGRYQERWWLAKDDGTTVQYLLDMQLSQLLPFGGNYSATLQLRLRLKQTTKLTQEALSHLQQATQKLQALDKQLRELERKPMEESIESWEQIFAQVQSWLESEKDEWLKKCVLNPIRRELNEKQRLLVEVKTAKGQFPLAMDFTLKDTDGNSHRLSDYKGKIVVLNFFGFG
ncbi:MAG: hypothetical protein QW795_08795 [Candidatus Bathyarchaeia archaeon]